MTYRIRLLSIALLVIAGIGVTAGLKPPGFLWLLVFEFVILITTFALFVRRQRSDRALDQKVASAFAGITDAVRRHLTHHNRIK